MKKRLSVIGLGKLGATMSACFIHKGFEVIGVDTNPYSVNKINNGQSPIYEPYVGDLIAANKSRIRATTETEFAVLHSDVSFIIVPTPSMDNGLFSTKYVEAVTTEIARALKRKQDYHLIVITSTVLPGDTARIAADIERISGKKLDEDFGVCYNPDFIALGSIVRDFLNPDMILIGESDIGAGLVIEEIHQCIVDNDPKIYRMNWHNAELSKISLNAFCTLKITFANTIAEICENMPGGDAGVVCKAVGSDTRVGNKYFRGGLGWGGPCFPRDNRALAKTAEGYGIKNLYCNLTDRINDYHKTDRICNLLMSLMENKNTNQLAILGLAYKEDTSIVEESVSIEVIKNLSTMGIKVTAYDPAAMEAAEAELPNDLNVTFETSSYACIKDQAVCFIATPWSEFKDLDLTKVDEVMKDGAVILDAWGIVCPEKLCGSNLEVRRIGRNYSDSDK